VLQLEQALTTGGGWQDQIGGAVDGVKLITTRPDMIPDPVIQFVPADVLDPVQNGGRTLLYYTGLTRLAKNILGRVVGRHLDRDPVATSTLTQLATTASELAGAMARRDAAGFGSLIDTAWRLNKQLDPGSSNDAVEALLARLHGHVDGAKLLGAGGGGFLLLACSSREAAARLRHELEADPPNSRARFFQFGVNQEGLRVTAC
ncbi:MAG: hypothetical protein HQ567_11805, partial [Candidatus Nealsonbacteria bacterium]|nr:hypothetical protein [Candidatus Nealsonbacteria bacterium]